MRMLAIIAGFVIAIVWDFTQNNGAMTNYVIREIIQLINSFGF